MFHDTDKARARGSASHWPAMQRMYPSEPAVRQLHKTLRTDHLEESTRGTPLLGGAQFVCPPLISSSGRPLTQPFAPVLDC